MENEKKYASLETLQIFKENTDNLYATKENVDAISSALEEKADTSHTHDISDVVDLQSALDEKAASSHTHTKDDISSVYDTRINWGGEALDGSVSPIGAALSSEHSANRLAYLNPNALTFETSDDGGTTWATLSVSDENKICHVTTGSAIFIGSASTVTTNHRLRTTITAQDGTTLYFYTRPRKMLINVNSCAHKIDVTIEVKTGLSGASWTTVGTYPLSGWSAWNDIPLNLSTLGGDPNQNANIWYMRLTFAITSVNSSYITNKSSILGLRLFGDTCWTRTSNMGETGHLYSYDHAQNAIFPAKVTATSFVGSLSGNATSATSATKATQDASGNTITNTYATKIELDTAQLSLQTSINGKVPTSRTVNGKALSSNITLSASDVGAATSGHTHISLNGWSDTRDVDTVPNDYNSKLTVSGLKLNSTIGISDAGIYSGVVGFRSWSDSSGGDSQEIAFAANGNLYRRHGATTEWGDWLQFIDSGNIGSQSVASATKATQDASGNVITSTYATKTELSNAQSTLQASIDGKANSSHTHTIANVTNLQTTLDGKQATVTGGASTITSSNLTASRALISNSSGKVAVSAVTSTELEYLDGVTSNIQTQLDGKASSSHVHTVSLDTDVTGTSAITLAHNGKYKLTAGGNSVTFTMPAKPDIPDYITAGAKPGTTIGDYATAEGYYTTASGTCSHAEGYYTTALGNYSHAGGYYTIANKYQYVVGRYNADTTAPTSDTDKTTSAGLFIVGIGTSDSARSNGFRINPAGKVYGTGVFGTSGADYAEYFEWFDGNPNNEDRRGRFVTLDGGKIRYATSNDDYILGVVSANPSVAGDIQSESWHDMYLKDVYGSKLVEVVEVEETTNENGEVIPAHTEERWVLNPDYNPNAKYVSREERPEWAAIGIVGKLVVVDDGTCQVNGYCYPNVDGIATASQGKTNYRVMERLDDTHIRIFIR